MKFSYWEQDSWFTNVDYTIVGSGIVGLTCALRLRERFPNSKILILEKGTLPQGASTKNAGFACFGSVSELLEDLNSHSEKGVLSLVRKRINGLKKMRTLLGDEHIDYQEHGGYELFDKSDTNLYAECISAIPKLNQLLFPIFKENVYTIVDNHFDYQNISSKLIFNAFEGQIDTGKMMQSLLTLVYAKGIQIVNNCNLKSYKDSGEAVTLETNQVSFTTNNLLIATNGFASKLSIGNVKPARAQVLITEPIPDLHIKGTFHLDQGYYYFRNINNRILLGGGRNLDFKTEETTEMGQTQVIQNKLEQLLRDVIYPQGFVKVAHRWSGIMGVGSQKKPILKKMSNNTFCGVRLGGMGVAIGSTIGEELANLVD